MPGQTCSSIYNLRRLVLIVPSSLTKCIRDPWSVATRDKVIGCAFLKTLSVSRSQQVDLLRPGKTETGWTPSWRKARPPNCWRAHFEGDNFGIPVFSVVGALWETISYCDAYAQRRGRHIDTVAEKTGDALVATTIKNGVKERSFILSIWSSVCVAQQVHDRVHICGCVYYSRA